MKPGLVIGGVVLLIIVVLVILFFTVPSLKRIFMSEGDSCKPTDDEKIDNGDEYVLDEDKECIIDKCDTGYDLVLGECLSTTRSGNTCTPSSSEEIDKGISYEFDSTGGCFATACEDGYTLNNNVCELDTSTQGGEEDKTYEIKEQFIPNRDYKNTGEMLVQYLKDTEDYDSEIIIGDSSNFIASDVFGPRYVNFYLYDSDNDEIRKYYLNSDNKIDLLERKIQKLSQSLTTQDEKKFFPFREYFYVEKVSDNEKDKDIFYIKMSNKDLKNGDQKVFKTDDDTYSPLSKKYLKFLAREKTYTIEGDKNKATKFIRLKRTNDEISELEDKIDENPNTNTFRFYFKRVAETSDTES